MALLKTSPTQTPPSVWKPAPPPPPTCFRCAAYSSSFEDIAQVAPRWTVYFSKWRGRVKDLWWTGKEGACADGGLGLGVQSVEQFYRAPCSKRDPFCSRSSRRAARRRGYSVAQAQAGWEPTRGPASYPSASSAVSLCRWPAATHDTDRTHPVSSWEVLVSSPRK